MIGWKAVTAFAVTAASFGVGGFALHPGHTAHMLPHQNDPNYVPVLVWEDNQNGQFPQGTNLEYKPATDYWVCVANMEANPDMEGPCPGQVGP